ncbi:MAG TPA: enoyl-CoA hydratase-related protein [Pseudonocardia sp.]|jgi:enoyl-CoA hydratase/carnithine racemase|nr:enoyl-CoA hydratase-related protein [Pseudonocardia sp.]
MPDGPALRYDVVDGVATITLNRPEQRNVLSMELVDLFADAVRTARRSPEVRVVIVTGAGDRAFCAGGDLGGGPLVDATKASPIDSYRNLERIHEIARELSRMDKPYLAAINGAAIGAGMDIASMADLRFCSDRARFGMGYVKVGMIPGDGGAFYLPRIVGLPRALELIWTGDIFDAQQALDWGYVSAVHPPDELMSRVGLFARRLANGPAVAIRAAKRLVYSSFEVSKEQALDMAASMMSVVLSTEDATEGPAAFQERRDPKFIGR